MNGVMLILVLLLTFIALGLLFWFTLALPIWALVDCVGDDTASKGRRIGWTIGIVIFWTAAAAVYSFLARSRVLRTLNVIGLVLALSGLVGAIGVVSRSTGVPVAEIIKSLPDKEKMRQLFEPSPPPDLPLPEDDDNDGDGGHREEPETVSGKGPSPVQDI